MKPPGLNRHPDTTGARVTSAGSERPAKLLQSVTNSGRPGVLRPRAARFIAVPPLARKGRARTARNVAVLRQWRYARTDADWYDLTLGRAEHEHFSDRTLFEAADPKLLYPGLAHEIVNRYTLEFFVNQQG
jgi:hypothetical protein